MRKWITFALVCVAAVAFGGMQLAQAGNNSTTNSGIYGQTGDYSSPNQFADGGGVPSGTTSPPVEPVPEPGTITLLAVGLYALHRKARRHRNN